MLAGMKWFRANIRHGSRLALFALAVQFALSFGHFHGLAAQAAPALQSLAALSGASTDGLFATDVVDKAARQQPASGHDTDQQPGDFCAICAVIAMANAALFATPPLLPLPLAVESSYLTTGVEFVDLNAARVAFQPRAPPAS
jgi:Protein of unknown function (DUF2946)